MTALRYAPAVAAYSLPSGSRCYYAATLNPLLLGAIIQGGGH